MSDDIYENDYIMVNRFYGGLQRGVCFQFTAPYYPNDYIQIPLREVEEMCKEVLKYIKKFKRRFPEYAKDEYKSGE